MEPKQNDYKISFFRPTTRHAKIDRNMVIIFLCVWAIAVFGFQIALRVLEKPTPEETLTQFESVWENVKEEKANDAEKVQYAHALLTCLGKQSLAAKDRAVLQNAFSSMVYQAYPDTLREELYAEVEKFQVTKEGITSLTDPEYVAAKQSITEKVAPVAGIQPGTVQFEAHSIGTVNQHEGIYIER